MSLNTILLETNQKMCALNVLTDKMNKKVLETVLPKGDSQTIYNELHTINKKLIALNRTMDQKSSYYLKQAFTRQVIFNESQELLHIQAQILSVEQELLAFIQKRHL
jgi:hypothetical protein